MENLESCESTFVPIMKEDEIHPMAEFACRFILKHKSKKSEWKKIKNSLTPIEGTTANRLGEICLETLNRVERDEYIDQVTALGLAWYIIEFLAKDAVALTAKSLNAKKRRIKK